MGRRISLKTRRNESCLFEWEQGSYKQSGKEQEDRNKEQMGYSMEGFHHSLGHLILSWGPQMSMEVTLQRHLQCCSETRLSEGEADSGAGVCHIPIWPEVSKWWFTFI